MPSGIGATDMAAANAANQTANQPQPAGTGGGMPTAFNPPPQLQTGGRGKQGNYYVPPTQLSPLQISPLTGGRQGLNVRNMYSQLIPTSVNVRNVGLQSLLTRMNTPMEQLYGGALADQAANQYVSQNSQLASNMAERGLMQSGINQQAQRASTLGYGSELAGAENQAQGIDQSRQLANIQALLGVTQSDLQFYGAIRSGTIPASTLYMPQNFGWDKVAGGIAQLVRSVASAGAGAAAGGGGGASGGSGLPAGMDYGSTATPGEYGMSYGGVGGAGGEYGMSSPGLTGYSAGGSNFGQNFSTGMGYVNQYLGGYGGY